MGVERLDLSGRGQGQEPDSATYMPRAAKTKQGTRLRPAKPAPPHTYSWDWDQLLDGGVYQLEQAEDYGDQADFLAALEVEVARRGITTMKTQVDGTSVIVQVDGVLQQQTPPSSVVVEETMPDGSPVPELPAPIVVADSAEDGEAQSALARERAADLLRSDHNLQAIWLRVMGEAAPPAGPKPPTQAGVSGRMEYNLADVSLQELQAEIVRRHARPAILVPMIKYVDEVIKKPVYVQVRVDEAGNELAVQPVKQAPPAATKSASASKESKPGQPAVKSRYELFGVSVTAVVRALGKLGWTFEQTVAGLKRVGAEAAEATIRIQLRAGVKGERGAPAVLTPAQIKQLQG